MVTETLVLFLIIATVARAKQQGCRWIEIAAFPSQWFNWLLGRDFQETFSAYVGLQVREEAQPRILWRFLCAVIDFVIWPRERYHCAETLYRLEKKNRNRQHTG